MNDDGSPYVRSSRYLFNSPGRAELVYGYLRDGHTEEYALERINAFEKERLDEEEAGKKGYEARNADTWKTIKRYREEEARFRALAEKYAGFAAREKSDLKHREFFFIHNRQKEKNAARAAKKLADEEATAKRKREDEEDTALENLNPR